jgi:glycogen debranching enzyme
VRTLSSTEVRYNPMSYHNGSVWPHDNALLAAGLSRYGATDAARTLFLGLFDAFRMLGDRSLPELLCGFPRSAGEPPTRYPVACSPQAWAAASVSLLLQATLGFAIDAGAGEIRLERPLLPHVLDHVTLQGLEVGDAAVDLLLERDGDAVGLRVLRRVGSVEVVLAG